MRIQKAVMALFVTAMVGTSDIIAGQAEEPSEFALGEFYLWLGPDIDSMQLNDVAVQGNDYDYLSVSR